MTTPAALPIPVRYTLRNLLTGKTLPAPLASWTAADQARRASKLPLSIVAITPR